MAEAQFAADPLVVSWQAKLLKKSKSIACIYGEFLFAYWSKSLKTRGLTLSGWLDELRQESEAKDITVRTRWGTDLEEFVTAYVSESTRKGYTFKSRRILVTAIRSLFELPSWWTSEFLELPSPFDAILQVANMREATSNNHRAVSDASSVV